MALGTAHFLGFTSSGFLGGQKAATDTAPDRVQVRLKDFGLHRPRQWGGSRVAPEIVMDLGIGDFFDARVAGNVISDDVLGSMEFECKEEGSKLILVLGHTGCGAIKGAIDNLQLRHLTNLLAKIRPAIRKTVFDGERSSKNPAFVEAVSRTNVLLTIEGIKQQSPVLEELESQRAIKIAGAMYNLATAKIDFMS
jgi:carbonic anhydrase